MTGPDLHLDTGAMALGALPDDEAALVQAHLETCESCAAELAGFRETVAMLAAVSAERPPASLRAAIMHAVAVTPQLPPLASPSPAARPEASAAAVTPPAVDETNRPDNVVPLRRWYRRPGALVAAAIAAVVLGAGALVAVNQARDSGQQVAQTPQECVALAQDRQTTAPVAGQGEVVYAPSCGAVTIDVTGLPDLPDDQTYQLWALGGEKPRSLDPLAEASAGQPQLVTRATQTGENAVAITIEPAGGSVQPTLPIIWQATLGA